MINEDPKSFLFMLEFENFSLVDVKICISHYENPKLMRYPVVLENRSVLYQF